VPACRTSVYMSPYFASFLHLLPEAELVIGNYFSPKPSFDVCQVMVVSGLFFFPSQSLAV
jgi:hypothetical protein